MSISPLGALERATLPGLERPPCAVSFSGGRDSSLVLAAATRAAARAGLPPPIPVTLRFDDAPEAEESRWQERVIAHLGISDWRRLTVRDELDLVGPTAMGVIARHGVLHPNNTYAHAPLFAEVPGGALLTGIGGDDLFGRWRWRSMADALARRSRPRAWDLVDLASLALPARARRELESVRHDLRPPRWLRQDAFREVTGALLDDAMSEPVRWRDWTPWEARRRMIATSAWSLDVLAADEDARAINPLLEPGFVAALAKAGGNLGFGDRTALMRALFADALPDEVLARPDKAYFNQSFWRGPSRRLIEEWDGEGVDHDLVDPDALRREWSWPVPDAKSAMLLQAVAAQR